jgi:L-amino acid N-acyltransferase YncA
MKEVGQQNLRSAQTRDAKVMADIYNYYISNSIVTFEETPLMASDMEHRLADAQCYSLPWLVAEIGGVVRGYAYATRWRSRSAYRFSVETTVYTENGLASRGLGSALYKSLLVHLGNINVHAVMAGIALPNDASVGLHEKFGFRKIAHFEQVGFKFKQWVDVGYWQLTLNCEVS